MARPIAALFAAFLVCSCATTEVPYRELREGDGRLTDAAVVALQVVIEATDLGFTKRKWRNTGISERTHPILHILLEDGETYRTLDIPLAMAEQDWELLDGRYRFSRIVTAKVPLGTYLLKALELYLGVTQNVSSSTTTWYLLWYPRVGFEVAEPGVYTLGSLFLDMAVKSGTSWEDLIVASRMSFDQGAESIRANATAVAERDPSLATDPLPLAARYAYSLWTPQVYDNVLDRREDALWPNSSSDRIEAGFEGRTFFVNKRVSDDRIDWIRPVADQHLPERYDMEWDARLLNGESGKRYGLMLGSDERNAYVFAASGDGTAEVMQVVDGTWQKPPLGPVPSAAHAMSGGEANRFLVSVRGNRVEFSVNGEALGRFTSAYDLSLAFLAPCLESRGVLTIDRFRISGTP